MLIEIVSTIKQSSAAYVYRALTRRLQRMSRWVKASALVHSYFCNMELDEVTDEKLQSIVEYELIPMLKEYWFDEPLKVKEWSDNLRSAVK